MVSRKLNSTIAASALAGAHRVGLATSGGLADVILGTVRRGLELSWIDEYPKKVAALSLKQVNGTIQRYVDPAKFVVVRAGTFKEQVIDRPGAARSS